MTPYFSQKAIKIYFWEFIQNFPLFLGFMFTLSYLKEKEWVPMLVSSTLGSVVGALLIRYTEPNILPGKLEPVKVTLTNLITFLTIMIVISFYFAQAWGAWWTDLLIGSLLGFFVGYAQDLAAHQRTPGFRHILALSAAFVPALWMIRFLTDHLHPLLTAIILNTIVTLVIILIDYLQPAQQPLSEGSLSN